MQMLRKHLAIIIKLIVITILIIPAVYIYHPGRHASHYNYVLDSEIFNELVQNNNNVKDTNLKQCLYDKVVDSNTEASYKDVIEPQKYHKVSEGGEYQPDCNPLYQTAVIISYRNRPEQLLVFINYMHSFLQKQRIKYRIFVAEQNNSKPFNRAKMLNVGATVAMNFNYSCLILQDVDLLPLNSANMYACTKKPRHLSSCIDTFRFNLPYGGIFGGAISILSKQFIDVNGMSNMYDGWGAEDDDFYMRLEEHSYDIVRFSPRVSKYIMLHHAKEKPSEARISLYKSGTTRMKYDGLNSLTSNYMIKLQSEYTQILVP